MIFQAYRLPSCYPICFSASSCNNAVLRLTDISSLCVPCAPARSSFAAAFDDVRRFRALGYVSAVRMVSFNQSTTI